MNSITLTNIPTELPEAIRQQEEAEGQSFNKTVLCMLEDHLGPTPSGRSVIEMWTRAESLLLQRLAIHGLAAHPHISAIQTAKHLLTGGRLSSDALHHEVFNLLRDIYSQLPSRWRERIVKTKRRALEEEYSQRESDDSNDLKSQMNYRWFSFLTWLDEAAPHCQTVQRMLEQVKRDHPAFPEPERPDLTPWSYGISSISAKPTLSTEEILTLRPDELVDELLRLEEMHDRSELYGFREVFGEAVAKNFLWSQTVAEHLATSHHRANDRLWNLLFDAWEKCEINEIEWLELISLLDRAYLGEKQWEGAAYLLERRFDSKSFLVSGCDAIRVTSRFALRIWQNIDRDKRYIEGARDYLEEAFNHPVGKLGLFAVKALSRAIKQDCGREEKAPELWRLLEDCVLSASVHDSR